MVNCGLTIGILKPVHVISENKGHELVTLAIKNAVLTRLKTMPSYSNTVSHGPAITPFPRSYLRDEKKTRHLKSIYVNNSKSLMVTTTAKLKQQNSMPGRKRCILCKTVSYIREGTYYTI